MTRVFFSDTTAVIILRVSVWSKIVYFRVKYFTEPIVIQVGIGRGFIDYVLEMFWINCFVSHLYRSYDSRNDKTLNVLLLTEKKKKILSFDLMFHTCCNHLVWRTFKIFRYCASPENENVLCVDTKMFWKRVLEFKKRLFVIPIVCFVLSADFTKCTDVNSDIILSFKRFF